MESQQQEPINLEEVPITPEIYPLVNTVSQITDAVPNIKDHLYFKLQMQRNEIIDV